MHDSNEPKAHESAKSQVNGKTCNAGKNAPVGALTLDCALYQHHLDDSDLTDKQKQEFLETLWIFVMSFVDLGFGIHPLQDAVSDDVQDISDADCGQSFELGRYLASEVMDVVKSPDQPTTDTFKQAADRPAQTGEDALQKREEI